MGYSQKRKAYRIFDPVTQDINEVRDVKFNEEKLGIELLKNSEKSPTAEIWMPDFVDCDSNEESDSDDSISEDEVKEIDFHNQRDDAGEVILENLNEEHVEIEENQEIVQEEVEEPQRNRHG